MMTNGRRPYKSERKTARAYRPAAVILSLFLCLFPILPPLFSAPPSRLLHCKHNPVLPLKIAFTGDILLDRGVRKAIDSLGLDRLFTTAVDSLLNSCQVVVGNLEYPATEIRQPNYKRFIFRGDPIQLDVLRRHGFTHLNLANNHSIDQGRRGLEDTWQNIRRAGMTPVGAGRDQQQAAAPVMLDSLPRPVFLLASLRLSLENFSYLPWKPSVSQEPLDTLLDRITALRRQQPEAFIIVTLHWGHEHSLTPNPIQRQEAHRIIDAGANLIIGHHTHTLQPSETYHGRQIFYSLGNFIFDPTREKNRRAAVVTVELNNDKAPVIRQHLIHIDNCTPSLVDNFDDQPPFERP